MTPPYHKYTVGLVAALPYMSAAQNPKEIYATHTATCVCYDGPHPGRAIERANRVTIMRPYRL